jgi:hypothetical protein
VRYPHRSHYRHLAFEERCEVVGVFLGMAFQPLFLVRQPRDLTELEQPPLFVVVQLPNEFLPLSDKGVPGCGGILRSRLFALFLHSTEKYLRNLSPQTGHLLILCPLGPQSRVHVDTCLRALFHALSAHYYYCRAK